MKIICNTTPFIALSSIGKIELLSMIYPTIIVPEAVIEEINAGGKIYVPDLTSFKWVEIIPNIEDYMNIQLLFQLGYGEQQLILNALNINADLVLIDDLTARNISEFIGLTVKGTLSVLVNAKRLGLIESFRNDAMKMKDSGIRYSQKLIDRISKQLGESI